VRYDHNFRGDSPLATNVQWQIQKLSQWEAAWQVRCISMHRELENAPDAEKSVKIAVDKVKFI